MMRTVNILISGRVQGVCFRKFTKHKAQNLGIRGTVRNTEDGKVEVVAQAESDILETFIEWCRKGPITARVDNIEITDCDKDSARFGSFEII